MKNRCEQIVLEAEEDITFKVSKKKNGKVVISATKVKFKNYEKPPIPSGYKYVEGEWNNGFVIERVCDGSQFVWVPSESLDADGTLDGENFNEKFGRRNYRDDSYFEVNSFYKECLNGDLLEQLKSVIKYGGFYISRYNISKGSDGKPHSVKGAMPWVNIDFYCAQYVATIMEENKCVKSHLVFGAEYDTVLAWFIKSGARTLKETAEDSSKWGAYLEYHGPYTCGSNEEWCTNKIYDLAGNVNEWIQEKAKDAYCVARGGNYHYSGMRYPVATGVYCNPEVAAEDTGFRVVLCIK